MEKLNLNPNPLPRLQPAPERDAFDYSVAAARVGGLVFPFLGAGATFFDLVTAPLRGKRLSSWLEELRIRLNDLSQKVAALTPESLALDDAFISAFAQATQSAVRTHQREKLDALRNAVLNVAHGKDANADRQGQFISLVDRFTAAHLKLLYFFQNPAGHFERRGIPVPTVVIGTNLLVYQLVCAAMPELRQELQSPSEDRTAAAFQMFEVLFDDLVSAKLIRLQRVKDNEAWIMPRFSTQPTPYPVNPVTTHLGDDFLAFITEPQELLP